LVVTPSIMPCLEITSISFKEAVSRKNWTTRVRLDRSFRNRVYKNC